VQNCTKFFCAPFHFKALKSINLKNAGIELFIESAYTDFKLMQYNLPTVTSFLTDSILKAADEEMTGVQILIVTGLLAFIIRMQQENQPLTGKIIANKINVSHELVNKNLKWLEEKGIVNRTPIVSAHGRGRTYLITLAETDEYRKLLGLKPKSE
jgi:DNA-binding MarR family transcriptional regulator